MGLSEPLLCVDSNSLTPLGPFSKQNQPVLFYSNNFTQFCKWLTAIDGWRQAGYPMSKGGRRVLKGGRLAPHAQQEVGAGEGEDHVGAPGGRHRAQLAGVAQLLE